MALYWSSQFVSSMIGAGDVAKYRPEGLNEAFGLKPNGYYLYDAQAQAILELRLQRLTGLEQDKIRDEYKEVIATIADLIDNLAKQARIVQMIQNEHTKQKEEFADKSHRRDR